MERRESENDEKDILGLEKVKVIKSSREKMKKKSNFHSTLL